jgi:hypothetical protein
MKNLNATDVGRQSRSSRREDGAGEDYFFTNPSGSIVLP